MTLTIAVLVAFALALGATAVLVRTRSVGRQASAGEERWRTDSVSRFGGVAILVAFLLGAAVLAVGGRIHTLRLTGFVAAVFVIAAAGLVDDLKGLSPLQKVITQILATAILLATGTTVEIVGGPLGTVLTFVWVIAITNAMNLLDNMDGLAAGVGLVSALVLAAHAHIGDLGEVVAVGLILAAAIAGFLPFNFRPNRPARIFMGDSGSQLIGFSLSWLALAASSGQASSLAAAFAVPVIVLAIPILDTAFVSTMRVIEGRRISQGGRDHTSHRLVLSGLSETRAVALLIGASGALGASSFVYARYKSVPLALVGVALSAAVLVYFLRGLLRARAASGAATPDDEPTQGEWVSLETTRLHKRRLLEGLVDFVLIAAAYYLAYILRYDRLPSTENARLIVESFPFVLAIRYIALWYFGLYKGLWRYVGIGDIARVGKAVLLSEVVTVAALTVVFRFHGYSRSLFVIDGILCFLLVAGSRAAERGIGEWLVRMRDQRDLPTALIIGAGNGGVALARELRTRGEFVLAGFVDDDPAKMGARAQGAQVVGGTANIEMILDRYRPEVVYVTIPDAPRERLQHVEAACQHAGARCTTIRAYENLTSEGAAAPI